MFVCLSGDMRRNRVPPAETPAWTRREAPWEGRQMSPEEDIHRLARRTSVRGVVIGPATAQDMTVSVDVRTM